MQCTVTKINETYEKRGLTVNVAREKHVCLGDEETNSVLDNDVIEECEAREELNGHQTEKLRPTASPSNVHFHLHAGGLEIDSKVVITKRGSSSKREKGGPVKTTWLTR